MVNNFSLSRFLNLSAASLAFMGILSPASQAEAPLDINKLTNMFSTRIVEFAVAAARSQVEIQYEAIVPNSNLGQLSIDGLVFTPRPEIDMEGCNISVGRILFQVGSPEKLGSENIATSIYDLNVSPFCLPFEQRGILAIAGIQEIHISYATINLDYYFPSSSLEILINGELKGFSEFDLFVDAPYVSIIDDYKPYIIKLKKAELSVRDRGGWSAVTPQIPNEFIDPNIAGENVSNLVKENMFSDLRSEEENAFLDSLKSTWNTFLRDPQQITLETGNLPSAGIMIDFEKYQTDPKKLFLDLKLVFSTQSLLSENLIDPALLEQILDYTPKAYSEERKFKLAKALMQGKGVPSNARLATRLLEELADSNSPNAFSALVDHYFYMAPEKAYFYALKLGRANETAATSFLDRLEAELSFDKVLELQSQNQEHPQ